MSCTDCHYTSGSKVLVVTFKYFHGFISGYLKGCLFPIVSIHLTWSGRHALGPIGEGMLLGVARTYAFSVVMPALWNIFPLKIRMAPTLLVFHKSLKPWFCARAWGSGYVQ